MDNVSPLLSQTYLLLTLWPVPICFIDIPPDGHYLYRVFREEAEFSRACSGLLNLRIQLQETSLLVISIPALASLDAFSHKRARLQVHL